MTVEEWRSFSDELLTAREDQAGYTQVMARIGDAIAKDIADITSTKSERDRFAEENEKLRKANMELFLRVGESQGFTGGNKKEEETKDLDSFLKDYLKGE